MKFADSVALLGRHYEHRRSPRSGSTSFSLAEVLQAFSRTAILELTPHLAGHNFPTVYPDLKRRISLLDDGIAAIHSDEATSYEVSQTAPSGDLSKVRIVAHAADGHEVGEIRMLIGTKPYEYYTELDPRFLELNVAH